jgi:hypothetical protein
MDLVKWAADKNKEYSKENIKFTDYCKGKMQDRGIDEELVISSLMSRDLSFIEPQKRPYQGETEERYKLIYRISSRYFLIVVVVYDESILKVINVIKTSKDMEKIWRKKILK